MKTQDILISALTSDPDLRLVEHDAAGCRLRVAAGDDELHVAWDDRGDTEMSATFPMALPEAVRRLPEWRHQLDTAVRLVEADRGPFVTCRVTAESPWTVEVRVRVLADGLTRQQLLGAVEEIRKVRRVVAFRVEALCAEAMRISELMSLVDGVLVRAAPTPPAPPAPGTPLAPPLLPG